MRGPALEVYNHDCRGDGARSPAALASRLPYELCLVRSGCFRYRGRRGTVLVDPVTAVLGGPDNNDFEVDHPQPGGDRDTFIRIDTTALAAVAGGEPTTSGAIHLTPWLELAHRRLVTTADRHPEGPLVEELGLEIVSAAIATYEPKRVAADLPRGHRLHAVVDEARAALVVNPNLTLIELAQLVACSPHHLSRLFRRATGVGVAAYRLGLRTQRALEGLTEESPPLAELASACGFADHAHLTHTLVARFGVPPSALRAHLASDHDLPLSDFPGTQPASATRPQLPHS